MSELDLVRMINQIADFYQPYPREEAIAGVSEHIKLYWEPRMRDKLRAMMDAGGEGFSEIAHAGAVSAIKR